MQVLGALEHEARAPRWVRHQGQQALECLFEGVPAALSGVEVGQECERASVLGLQTPQFARPAAALNLYHVRFTPKAIWPDATGEAIVVELYETWLEPK